MLTADVLRQLYPNAPQGMINAFAQQAPTVFAAFGISKTQNRLHFFLAQIGHESGGKPISENLNYSAPRLRQVWPSRFPTEASTVGFAHEPEALANHVYGGRMGNGANNGDGWKYRGRGLIQITGKDGYQNTGANSDGDGSLPKLNLVTTPDLALDPAAALQVACGFWAWKKINAKCDAGDFVGVTKLINGGTVGLQERFKWLQKVQDMVAWPLDSSAPPPAEPVLSVPQLKAAQLTLKALGLYDGSIDGIFGKRSRAALKVFQGQNGLPVNGRLTAATLTALKI